MRRWIAQLIIGGYISALIVGTMCHTLKVGMHVHPVMYFLVWDMYSAWNAYHTEYRLVAEGVSGKYYDLDPAPWGSFKPYGNLERLQYINPPEFLAAAADHVNRTTRHEPLARMFLVEQTWSKKFDLADEAYLARYGRPKEKRVYYNLKMEITSEGRVDRVYPSWIDLQCNTMLADNPRLQQEIRNSRPFWLVDQQRLDGNHYFRKGPEPDSMISTSIVAPMGN